MGTFRASHGLFDFEVFELVISDGEHVGTTVTYNDPDNSQTAVITLSPGISASQVVQEVVTNLAVPFYTDTVGSQPNILRLTATSVGQRTRPTFTESDPVYSITASTVQEGVEPVTGILLTANSLEGTLTVEGNTSIQGNLAIPGFPNVSASLANFVGGEVTRGEFNAYTSSQEVISASFDTRIDDTLLSASLYSASLENSISGNLASYLVDSASFDSRIDAITGSDINTGSFVTTSSFNAYTSSQDELNNTFATTGSNTFTGDQRIRDAGFTLLSGSQGAIRMDIETTTSGSRIISNFLELHSNTVNTTFNLDVGTNLSIGGIDNVSQSIYLASLGGIDPSRFATTGSNQFKADQGITGSLSFHIPGQRDVRSPAAVSQTSLLELSEDTTLAIFSPVLANGFYFIGQEVIEVVSRFASFHTIRRGLRETEALPHAIGTNVYSIDQIADLNVTYDANGITGRSLFEVDTKVHFSQSVNHHEDTTFRGPAAFLGDVFIENGVTISGSLQLEGVGDVSQSIFEAAQGGIDPSRYVTTASFNAFTSSYNTDSASFDVRIDTNSSSIYQVNNRLTAVSAAFDEDLETTFMDVENQLNSFTASYYVDSASFDTRIQGNGNAILSESFNRIQGDLDVLASASLFSASLENSISGNLANYLVDSASFDMRIDEISGSGIDTGSFATTGSNTFTAPQTIIHATEARTVGQTRNTRSVATNQISVSGDATSLVQVGETVIVESTRAADVTGTVTAIEYSSQFAFTRITLNVSGQWNFNDNVLVVDGITQSTLSANQLQAPNNYTISAPRLDVTGILGIGGIDNVSVVLQVIEQQVNE